MSLFFINHIKETVAKTEPQQPINAVSGDSSLSENEQSGISLSEPNGESTVSNSKDRINSYENKEVHLKILNIRKLII